MWGDIEREGGAGDEGVIMEEIVEGDGVGETWREEGRDEEGGELSRDESGTLGKGWCVKKGREDDECEGKVKKTVSLKTTCRERIIFLEVGS